MECERCGLRITDRKQHYKHCKRGRRSRKVERLVGFAKTLFWLSVAIYVVCVAVDHNQLREMKKQALKLEIELLELQLGK